MIKVLPFILLLSGCTIGPHMSISLERSIQNCRTITAYEDWFVDRKSCLRHLNYDTNHYKQYLRLSCQQILEKYKYHWEVADRGIISDAKFENKPLPENFKTAEEIFRDYPNPCQDSKIFEQEVKVYEAKQKVKNS